MPFPVSLVESRPACWFLMLISWFRLTNLTLDLGSGRNPRKGGQNYTHCCLLAVNASLDIQNGFIVETLSSFIQSPIEDLLAATEANQFPCTAKWDGNPAGAPVVQVPYSWLEEHVLGDNCQDRSQSRNGFHLLLASSFPQSCFVSLLVSSWSIGPCSRYSDPFGGPELTLYRPHDPTSTETRRMEQALPPRPVTGHVMDYCAFRHACSRCIRHH